MASLALRSWWWWAVALLVAVAGRGGAAKYVATEVFLDSASCDGSPDTVTFALQAPANATCTPVACAALYGEAQSSGGSTDVVCALSTATSAWASYAVQETYASTTCAGNANVTFAARLGTCVPAGASYAKFVCESVLGTTVAVTTCSDAACTTSCLTRTTTSGECVDGVRYSCPPIYVGSLWFWVAVGAGALLVVIATIVIAVYCVRRRRLLTEDEAFGDVVRLSGPGMGLRGLED